VLLDGNQGDVPLLFQFVAAKSDTGLDYSALTKMATFAPLVQQDGVAATLSGQFVDVPQTGSTTLGTWDRKAFEQLRTLTNASPMPGRHFLGIRAQPRGLGHGALLRPIDLVEANGGGVSATVGKVSYGNPLSPDWGIYGVASATFEVDFALPARKPLVTRAEQWFEDELTAFASGPMQPQIGVPGHPTLNGMDAFTTQTLSQPVTLAWAAPAMGTATIYHAYLYQLVDQQGTTARNYVAEFHTAEATQFTIPSGVLMPRQSYYFSLYAENVAGVDGKTTPLRRALPRSGANLITALFSVQQ
jgi:hypothetical protein